MIAALLPIADEYLRQTITLNPGDRLHRLAARLADTHFDDLSDERIEAIERHIDQFRWMHASGQRFTGAA